MNGLIFIVARGIKLAARRNCFALGVAIATVSMSVTNVHAISNESVIAGVHLPHGISDAQVNKKLNHWRDFVKRSLTYSDAQKLEAVNAYFGQMRYVEDTGLWEAADYWATPLQLIAVGAGDCEDFAIAKFFTLLALGMPVKQLRMTYVWEFNARSRSPLPHMVLTYYSVPGAEPLVLDILTKDIKLLSERKDLQPAYAFNTNGLWFPGEQQTEILAGSPAQLSQWRELSQRLKRDLAIIGLTNTLSASYFIGAE